MRIHVIVNPAAGQPEPILAPLNRVFCEHGVEWDVSVTSEHRDTCRTARDAAQRADRVAVYGGDGTVAQVAAGLLGGDVPLALLPGGTGNVIAQDLGVPIDLEEAARIACSENSTIARLDVLRSDAGVHLMRVGVGLDARAIVAATREQKDRLGWFAYASNAASELFRGEAAHYRLVIDGREIETAAVTCIVANIGRLGRGGFVLADGVDPFDGALDVLLLRDCGFDALAAAGASLLGFSPEARMVGDGGSDAPLQRFRAAAVRIEVTPRQPVQADGDPIGETPVEVHVGRAELPVVLEARED